MIVPKATVWVYEYYPNNLLKKVELTGSDNSTYYVAYTYDEAGNRKTVTDSGNRVENNLHNGTYRPDPLNRIHSIDRHFDGATYRTEYQYEKPALLTGIKYPEADTWLEYEYNSQHQLAEVVGFTDPAGIEYDQNGALTGINYRNNTQGSYRYDQNRRLQDLQVTVDGQMLLGLDYLYDAANNIIELADQVNHQVKTYRYDRKNQLTLATTPGIFLEHESTSGNYGYKAADFLGASWLDFFYDPQAVISLDYHSSSIGLDFGTTAPGIKKIVLTPDTIHRTHRLEANSLDLYISTDNLLYTPVSKEDWEFAKDPNGVITLTLTEKIAARYLKIHVLFDDRDQDFAPVDKATFLNELAGMLKVYQEADSRTEEYEYDAEGNRSSVKLQLVRTFQYQQEYYPNSNRLKTDGKYEYAYDANGNLITKEKIERDPYEPEKKWAYTYDLLNRLIRVTKNGILVAEYGYDPEGFRVVKKSNGETNHYVFEGTEPIFEKRVTVEGNATIRSYVYALGKHLARVDGVIGDPEVPVYFYHTDHLGSVRVVTNLTGEVVWNADYFAFGTKYGETAYSDFEEWRGFTGKEYDPDTGLYYYNARWYDSELGRFISEDPMADPNNPNLYVYGRNNPLRFFDPTGLRSDDPKLDLPEIEIDITPPKISNPAVSTKIDTINLDALNSFQIVTFISELVLNSPNVDLATFAEGIQSMYPNIDIKIADRNKIIIQTSKIASGEKVNFGSIQADGEFIQIEKSSSVDKNTGEITTNYSVHITDRLSVTSINPEEGNNQTKDAIGTTLGNAGPGFIGISHSMSLAILFLDVKFTSSGYIQAQGSFGCDKLTTALLSKAYIELPTGEKVNFDRRINNNMVAIGTPDLPGNWYDLKASLITEPLINSVAILSFYAGNVEQGAIFRDQIKLDMYLGFNQ